MASAAEGVPPPASPAEDASDSIELVVTYGKASHSFSMPADASIAQLKEHLQDIFFVAPANQRLLGLPKPAAGGGGDEAELRGLPLKRPQKIMLMGPRDEEVASLRAAEAAAAAAGGDSVLNDLEDIPEADVGGGGGDDDICSHPLYQQRIAARVASYKPKMVHGFRGDGRGITLVLDIDYTLIDHRSVVEKPAHMARPFLIEFLAVAYRAGYDIVIWSATSMKWIDTKMGSLGVTSSPHFRIAAFLDHGAMVTVQHSKYGFVDVNPLGVLWGLFPGQCRRETTIMFDDLRRNFLLNPANGLRIEACRNLPATRGSDSELAALAQYLVALARLPSFEGLNHRKWRHYVADRPDAAAAVAALLADIGGGGGGSAGAAGGAGASSSSSGTR
jgi:ubiquitin-like domain-containing CTD phosphatase 1